MLLLNHGLRPRQVSSIANQLGGQRVLSRRQLLRVHRQYRICLGDSELLRECEVAGRRPHFQHQSIGTERSPRLRRDSNANLDHLRLVRAEYPVGRVKERHLQTGASVFDLASDETSGSPANDFPVQETMTAAKTAAIKIDVRIEPHRCATFDPRTSNPRIGNSPSRCATNRP